MPGRFDSREEFEERVFDHIWEQRQEREEEERERYEREQYHTPYEEYDLDELSECENPYETKKEYYETLFQKEVPSLVLEFPEDKPIHSRVFTKEGFSEITVSIYKEVIIVSEKCFISQVRQELTNGSHILLEKDVGETIRRFPYNPLDQIDFELIAFKEDGSHDFVFALKDENAKTYNLKITLDESETILFEFLGFFKKRIETCFLEKIYRRDSPNPFEHGLGLTRVVKEYDRPPYYEIEDIHKGDDTVQNDYMHYVDIEVARYILAYLFTTLNLRLVDVFFPVYNHDVPILESLVEDTEVEKYSSFFRTLYRVGDFKEELMAAAWHPSRIAAWLEAGAKPEDL